MENHDRSNPYDEVPYKSVPIEWTAPERLALTALLHGGPRAPLDGYRLLELGCGDGANLLPLAYYRQDAAFVGVDGARSRIDVADLRKSTLKLRNVEFIHADFLTAADRLCGEFDYVLAHGVFSWVREDVQEELFELCSRHLRRGGLLYLNYNTKPGWNVRGMVREFLLTQTAASTSLARRCREAQEVAARMVSSVRVGEHPYSQLIANEFRFVCESDSSYVAHEYLGAENHSYWRSEFLAMAQSHRLTYVADADFNYHSGRVPQDLTTQLVGQRITGRSLEDTVDLLCYRQLHSPIFTPSPFARRLPALEELANLRIASCLVPSTLNGSGHLMLRHPSGYEVEAKEEAIAMVLTNLQRIWPRSVPIEEAFDNVSHVMNDLRLLHSNGLIELRITEAEHKGCDALHWLESRTGGYVTSPYHTRETVPRHFDLGDAI